MATASTLNADVDSARTAMLALEWQTALDLLLPIKLLLATRPDTLMGGGMGMRFNAQAIDELITQCQAKVNAQAAASRAAAGCSPFVQVPVRYERG